MFNCAVDQLRKTRFTHVDPFEDTESSMLSRTSMRCSAGFTHVDPFEDTESLAWQECHTTKRRFTHVDPFEDTERTTQQITK